MKLATILSFSLIVSLNASVLDSYGQAARLTMKIKDATLKEAMDKIEKSSDFIFIYYDNILDVNQKVSLDAKNQLIENILDELFAYTHCTYKVTDRQIVICLKSQPEVLKDTSSAIEEDLQQVPITGTVTDSKGGPLTGVTVAVKGTTIGSLTDAAGKYSINNVPLNATLVFSFIGMSTQEIPINGQNKIDVVLIEQAIQIDEVVVVGYGSQKKSSVVGAILNTKSEDLQKRGGSTNLFQAMSGQMPGVAIMERTGDPGREDPSIIIRGQSTWNATSPLILVDGFERSMGSLNVNEIESVSILKDASATAVYGVRGGNGVVLVTTKRGQLGRAKITASFSNTFNIPSPTTGLLESFSARSWKNAAIEHEVSTTETAWKYYTPYPILLRYQKPQTEPYSYLYPNVDWRSGTIRKFKQDQTFNLNMQGGTEFSKYFASISYLHQGDILNTDYTSVPGRPNRGYDPGYSYNRLNFRGNLDLKLSPTTTLSTNLGGYVAKKSDPNLYYNTWWVLRSLFSTPPDAFMDRYPDGSYGRNPYDLNSDLFNPIGMINNGGILYTNSLFIGTDGKLDQKLDFVTKGLSASATVSFDNTFGSSGPNINDKGNQGQLITKYINPTILDAKNHADSLAAVSYIPASGTYGFDAIIVPWTVSNESASSGSTRRSLYYKLALNYVRTFGKHDISGLFLFSRYKDATGANFASYREDWAGRATYAYGGKYFAEFNGAYNGSEKFGPGYRFGFFPSFGASWLVSEERFLKYDWLNKLKLRASIGKVGSDNGIPRWGYLESWKTGGNAYFRSNSGLANTGGMQSPYTQFSEGTIPNAELNWETSVKQNYGLELSVLDGKISVSADYYKDKRANIFMTASRRNVPIYFGAAAVPINLGKTETKGFELDVTYRNKIGSNLGYYLRGYITKAVDMVTLAEDPKLQDAYLKTVGYQIGQTKSSQRTSIGGTWNDVFAQTAQSNNTFKLPGDWDINDFNGDGLIDSKDGMAYGFPNNRPRNTYSTFLGLDYKGFSFMIQFYGVTGITQSFSLYTPGPYARTSVAEQFADYWTPQNTDAYYKAPRLISSSPSGELSQFDGSYLRLKTIELSYKVPEVFLKRLTLTNMRLYVNGNNLTFWSKLPDETENGGVSDTYYPMMKMINIGVEVTF